MSQCSAGCRWDLLTSLQKGWSLCAGVAEVPLAQSLLLSALLNLRGVAMVLSLPQAELLLLLCES